MARIAGHSETRGDGRDVTGVGTQFILRGPCPVAGSRPLTLPLEQPRTGSLGSRERGTEVGPLLYGNR